MYKTSFRVSLLVIILMLPWAAIYAAGLGKLTLNSGLGQPLNAEIDIVTTNSDEAPSLKASVATREAFDQAGINYEPFFSSFKISIESRANGKPYIKLTSPQAVNDPFLNILMELNWASGRLLREYTLLLDPVEVNTQDLAAPNVGPDPIIVSTRQDPENASDTKKDRQIESSSKSSNSSLNQTKESYGPVSRGDTLSSIARQVLPTGVNLNQMLIALYRVNRDAFISNNMNLLKVGAILKIPEKSEITAIDASTAKAEIRTQVGDWHDYQGKMATISRELPAHHDISQSDHGQITTSIGQNAASAQGSPKEVLRLSSSAQLIDKDGQIPESTLADRLRMMEEEAIARDLALQEATQRVSMLEKSIENLKQLLELKDSVFAEAQIKAESDSKTDIQLEVQSPEIIDSLTEKDSKLNMDSLHVQAQKTPITQTTNEAIIKEAEVKLPSSPETGDQSLTDQIFDHIEYVGASLILILLIILLIRKKRRDQFNEETEIDEIGNTNFSSAMPSRMASVADAQAVPVTETDDSLPENKEDNLAYENINSYPETEEQDDEFDKDLAYYEESTEYIEKSESDAESVSELQEDNEPLADDSRLNNQSIDSMKDNDSSDFTNEIDFHLSDETDEIKQNLTLKQIPSVDNDVKESAKLSDNSKNLQEAINISDYELAIDFDDSKQSFDPVKSEDITLEKDKDDGIEFEFVNSAIDLTEKEPLNEIEIPKINYESLEFDQPQEDAQDTMKSESVFDVPELGLADINLDIEDSNSIDEKDEKSDLNDKSDYIQSVEYKLDLVKAYQDMLEEVIRDGDAEQKRAAKILLKNRR